VRTKHKRSGQSDAWPNTTTQHPFNGLFSRITWVSQHQKGTILDFSGARDDGMVVASAGPYVNHLHLAPDR